VVYIWNRTLPGLNILFMKIYSFSNWWKVSQFKWSVYIEKWSFIWNSSWLGFFFHVPDKLDWPYPTDSVCVLCTYNNVRKLSYNTNKSISLQTVDSFHIQCDKTYYFHWDIFTLMEVMDKVIISPFLIIMPFKDIFLPGPVLV
jgi:hypothetical protein